MLAFWARPLGVAQRIFHNVRQALCRGVRGNVTEVIEDEDKVDYVAGWSKSICEKKLMKAYM